MIPTVVSHDVSEDVIAPPKALNLYKLVFVATIIIAVLNVFDIITTMAALHFGAHEGNPVAAFLLGYNLLWPFKILCCAVACSSVVLHKPATAYFVCLSWFVAGVYSCVILVNLMTLARYAMA